MRANILGDPRAEHDKDMLGSAFLETADYRTLLETSGDRCLVVGRRGTGKSALAYKLKHHWRSAPKIKVASLSPDEDQMIGLRGAIKYFGDDFKTLRAGSRVIWKYAFIMEAVALLLPEHKAKKYEHYAFLKKVSDEWRESRQGVADRVRKKLKSMISPEDSVEDRVGGLAGDLQIRFLEDCLEDLLEQTSNQLFVVIDRLDEGYEPDDVGVGIIDGVCQAAIDLNSHIEKMRIIVFLRDNIYRSLSAKDPDFSRNIEGQTLRLHWDENEIFNLVASRLRVAFSFEAENAVRIWNRCVAKGLKNKDGFRACLRLTLYRPRDIVILLNQAFYNAKKQGRDVIVDEDVESTARSISEHRLDDLKKEYEAIVPGVSKVMAVFKGGKPDLLVENVKGGLSGVLSETHDEPMIAQQMAFFDGPLDVIKSLYSIGFLGFHNGDIGNFIFCHDGRQPDNEVDDKTRILVHPCYWMALNLTRNALDRDEAEDIYDEYDIDVSSQTPEQRRLRIGQLEAELRDIPEGQEGFSRFEDWCFDVLRVVFSTALVNFDKKPNGSNKNRRDIVATNLSKTSAWKRVKEDYKVTQVVFEVKNYVGLSGDEYRQMLSYLKGQYGNLGFVICRDDSVNLEKRKDLDWMRDMYNGHGVVIVKLTAKWLVSILHKLRNPQKHNQPDKVLNGLLDQYQRLYLSGS